ncbi:unnamed protein product [Trichobilharzia szidati]|nr:unnamed protein product [Trichobilharzia szidati]
MSFSDKQLENCRQKIVYASNTLTRKKKCKQLVTNTEGKSPIISEKSQITEETGSCEQNDGDDDDGNEHKKDFSSQIQLEKYSLTEKRVNENISNGYLVHVSDKNKNRLNDNNNNNNNHSNEIRYTVLKRNSQTLKSFSSLSCPIHQLMTSSSLTAKDIQSIMPTMNELIQADILCSPSNRKLLDRLNIIHKSMQEVMQSDSQACILLLSINDRQNIYEGLITTGLADRNKLQPPKKPPLSSLELTEVLKILQNTRQRLLLSIQNTEQSDSNNDNSDSNTNSSKTKLAEFDQIKATLLEVTKLIKSNDKLSLLKDTQYMSDSIEEVINSLENLNTVDISFEKDSELSSEIIEHLDDVINLNQKLIVTQGLEAIKENILKQTNQRNNQCILQRQSAIDIVAALKLIEDELYTSSITSNTTKDNKNIQQACNADHLKYIYKSIAKQLTLDDKDSSENNTIFCLSSDMNLLEDAFTKYCNKSNSHIKASPKDESTINVNNTSTNYITYDNTMSRFQDILSPISEHCTPETSAYETDTLSNESVVKTKISKIKKLLSPKYHQRNETNAYHSDDETQVLSICSKVQPENTSQTVSIVSAVGVDYPDLSTFIDDTLGEHNKETHSVNSDNSSNTSYNLISDQYRAEGTFLIDSSIIAPIVSFLKSKILDNQSNIFSESDHQQKSEYTMNDVKKISNYLTNCLYENPGQPVPLTGTNYNLLSKLLTADQSTYTNMLKLQLDSCIDVENPSHTRMATEETEAEEDEENGPVVNEDLTFLINTLQDNENVVFNKPFIEQLCSVVSNYSLSILPDKYPSLLAVINSSDDIECLSNNSEQFKQELSSELKQLLEVLHIELQSENMINRDGSMKEIVGYSSPRLPNDCIRSARPINFIQTVISLYILDLFCLLPNEMDQVIYLINIHKNFQSLVDYSELPSIHCSPVCTKLKSLFNLFSSHNTTPDSEIYRAINKMLPSIKVCVQTTKHSDIFQKHIEDILNRTKDKLTSKQYYFVNGETDDIVCGILIALNVALVKGTKNLNPHEIAKTLSEFCDFYHSLVNSKCIKLFDNISQPLSSLISSISHTEPVVEGKNDHHYLNLTDINSSILQVVSECLTELSEYKTMKFMQPLILLSLLLSQRRLYYEFTDFSSAEANILLSILLLLRSNFQINLQNSLTMIMKNLMNSLQNANTSIPLHRDDYISQRLYSSISPLRSVALIHENFDVQQGNSIVPYKTKKYSSNKLEVCTVSFDEVNCEKEFPVYISEQKSNSHNLFLHALTLREILNQPKTETVTNGLEIKPQYCRLLKSCLSEMMSSSSTVLPQGILKSTHQIMRDIHLAEVNNHSYHMNEETLNKLVVYSNNVVSHAKEYRMNDINQTIGNLPDNNQVEGTIDTVDSIKTSIQSNLIVRIIDQELKPTTWFTISHINKQVLECKTTIDEVKLSKDDSKIVQNILQMPQPSSSSSSSTADVCDQVILLAQLNQLKTNLKGVVNQNEDCILSTNNAENLFCILEMIKNQTEIMESLEEEEKDFINSVKLDIIPNCIIHSTPLIMNSKSMVKIQQVIDKISSAELNTIQTSISECLKDKQCTNHDGNNNKDQLAGDLILGQLAVLSYSKELKISPKDFDSLRDYCVLFQQGNNENEQSTQTIIPMNFLSNLSNNNNNNANLSDTYPKPLRKDILCIKLKRIQEFFNRIKINDEIANPISAYRLLVNTMELEYLARSHSLEINTIPECLKCSLISMLTTREKLFPYKLNEEESIHLKCLQKQLNYIINEMVDTGKVIHPAELPYHDYTCLEKEENICETSTPIAKYDYNKEQLINAPSLSPSQLNILKTCETAQCSSVENPLVNTTTEFINTSEECKEMNVAIEKFVNLSDSFRVFRTLTSKSSDDAIVESNQINNLATFISEVRLDEELVNNLTPDEIQEMDDVYYKLLEYKVENKAYSLSDVFNPSNLIQQNALHKITSHISALETKAQQLLNAKVEKVNHLISVMSNSQNEAENCGQGKVKDELYSSPEILEQDIDIETAILLKSTIQSYLELKQLPTIQTIPLVSLIENISSQVEMLHTEQCPTQRPLIKLSSSDLNQLSTVFEASKHQKLPETMVLCTKVLNFKILFDIISYDIPICEIESRFVYCAFRDLLSSSGFQNQVNQVMPNELLNNLEQRLRNYCHLTKIQQQQQPFVFSTAEIHSCKSLLSYYESEIKLEILQKLTHISKLLMINQSGEQLTQNSEITACKDIYYLVLMCLPNLSLNCVKYLRSMIDLLVTHSFIHNAKNYAYCLKNLFSSYNILIMFKGANSLQELLEINAPMSVSEEPSSSSTTSFSYLNTHYILFFTNLLENFIDIKKLEQSLSTSDILLLVYLLQILQSAIIHEKKLKAHLKHLITRLLFNFITNQSTFIDEYNKHLIDDLCKHVKWISGIQRVKLFTEGLNSLHTITADNNDFNTKNHCQQVSRCLQLILFNPLQGFINPLKAKQIACIMDNFNQSTCNPLRYPFIFQLIEQTLSNLCNDENLQSTNSPSTYIPYIFQCILMMESYFNKKLNEPSSFQMINREDAAVMCVSLAYLVNRNIEVINNLIDNDTEDSAFNISASNSWIKLLLLRMWYTFVACSQSHQHYQHAYRHSPYALELLKLEQNEIKSLTDYWKPRLELYSQIKRTVSIRELSISTECDLTAEMTNQQLRNAICLSLLNKQMNGPRNAWICINFLKELQSECEQEFISISNFEKEALRLALCSANIKPSETMANTDIIASVVCLNSLLSRMSFTTISSSTSFELPELFLIQPTDAAPFASSIQNILHYIYPDVHKPYSFYLLNEIECHLWISSANMEKLWISKFEFRLINELKQKASEYLMKSIRHELIDILNECDERNLIKPNLTCISIETAKRKNLAQLLRTFMLLNHYPLSQTINILHHLQLLHDMSNPYISVQTISYLRSLISSSMPNENPLLQYNQYDSLLDNTTFRTTCTSHTLDSCLINCLFAKDQFRENLSQDIITIIQTSLVYSCTCEEIINSWSMLPKHSYQRLNSCIYELFRLNLNMFANHLLKVITNDDEFSETNVNISRSIPLILCFLKYVLLEDTDEKHDKCIELQKSVIKNNISVKLTSSENIYTLNERLKQLLDAPLSQLSVFDLIQMIIDSEQFQHKLMFSKLFHEDLEYIPHLQYYLCNKLISELCKYSRLSDKEYTPQVQQQRQQLSITYEETAKKLRENINKIYMNLSIDGGSNSSSNGNKTQMCPLRIDRMKSACQYVHDDDADDVAVEIKSDTPSDTLINFTSCETVLYPVEDVRPEINRLNHLLAINTLQPDEMSAILSSIVVLRDASMRLPSSLKDYTHFSTKEEDALKKLQSLIDKKMILKLDKQLKTTLWMLSQRLGLLAIQANKDLLRTGLEIWLTASLENEFIFSKQQIQQIYYALCLADNINNEDYSLQTDFSNTFDLVQKVIVQLNSIVNAKVGAEIEGPHSLGPIVTLFLEHAQQLLEQVTFSEFLSNAHMISTNGIPSSLFVKQKTTAENLWKMITCQSPEFVEDTLKYSTQSQKSHSPESECHNEQPSVQTNKKRCRTLQKHPEVDEYDPHQIRQSYSRSLSYGKSENFQLNSPASCDGSLSLLALYNDEKRRLADWEETTETRLRKACERVEKLLETLPEKTHPQQENDHIITQLRGEVVQLKGQLNSVINQKTFREDSWYTQQNKNNSSHVYKEQCKSLRESPQLFTQERQFTFRDNFGFDSIQKSERYASTMYTPLSDRLASSTSSLKNLPSFRKRYINENYSVSCKPVTPDHTITSPPSSGEKRILQSSFDRLQELIEIRRAVVAGSREELSKLGIHSNLPKTFPKPVKLIRSNNKSVILPDSRINTTHNYDRWFSNNQRNIDRQKNYTNHLCRSEDEYSRSNQVIEDLEDKLEQLEEQILPHRINDPLVH